MKLILEIKQVGHGVATKLSATGNPVDGFCTDLEKRQFELLSKAVLGMGSAAGGATVAIGRNKWTPIGQG